MATIASWNSGTLPPIVAQNSLGTVTAQTAGPSNPPGPNIVRNHDFELGDSGWATNAFLEVVVAGGALSGSRVMRMNVDAGNRFPTSERRAATVGDTYTVTAWFRRQAGSTAIPVAPLMATWDASDTRTTTLPPAGNRGSASSTSWIPVTWTFTVPAGAVEVAFAPWAQGTPDGVVDVDDVDVRRTSAFPQNWMEFDQVANNNLAANFLFGTEVDELTCRFYYRAPDRWSDGSALIAALQTSPGPTEFLNRLVTSGTGRPGVLRLADGGAGELAQTNRRAMREMSWHRLELQYSRNRTAPVEVRARMWRTGSDLHIWDSGWTASPQGNQSCIGIRLGAHQDLSDDGQGQFGIAHVMVVDELTTIGRHSSDPIIPAHHRYSAWLDGELVPAKSVGVWNGTTVTPLTDVGAL